MKNFAQNTIKFSLKLFVIFITTLTVVPFYLISVNASLQDDLVAVQKRLQDIRNQKTSIQNDINNQKNISNQYDAEISKLKLQIDLLDAQVQEKQLVIEELDLQINLLNLNIKSTEDEIATAETSIKNLEQETDQRMVDIYINEKTSSQLNVFFSSQSADLIKYSVYQNSVQQETNNMVTELNSQKDELLAKKTQLENDRLNVVTSQTQLNEEKLTLTTSKSEYDQKQALFIQKRNAALNMVNQYSTYYKNMTSQEKKAEEEQEAIMRVIMARTEAGNGVYVKAGTFIGIEGSTGNSTGPHLHFAVMVGGNIYNDTRNPCDYLTYNIYPGNGDDNCDHKGNGQFTTPMSPTGRLTSGYKPWYRPSHLGIDISSGTGQANIISAHDGYVYFFSNDGTGWGTYAKICAVRGCTSGIRTVYAHMRCTAEPKGTVSRSCNN